MQHIEKPGDSNKNTDRPRSVYIATYGCQMNVRDSEVIAGLLKSDGCELTANPDDADVIIFNTCSVRQHAEDKVWSEVGRYKTRKRANAQTRQPVIGIVGCMAQNYKEKIFERCPQVDFVVGPTDIHKIQGILKELVFSPQSPVPSNGLFERKIWETDGIVRPEEIYHTGFHEDKEHAYVVISEGCSNYCSYCVVPHVRGELHNRNYEDILKEIKEAIDNGITKITLLGQNVNAYRFSSQPEVNFTDLLKMVNDIGGLKEFSFVTSHPKDTSLELFQAMSDLQKLKKYLHLPIQSGSDKILKSMNRGYSRKFYLDLVDNYRKIVTDGALTTDIILGFPTETEQDFQATLDLVKSVEFDAAYIFKYSTRPHTEAAKIPDDVENTEKERRHALILELQKSISRKKK